MKSNIAEFSFKVSEYAKNIPAEKILVLHKKIILEALKRIVMKTPVDTGRARGNWQVTIGIPAEGIVEDFESDISEKIKKARTFRGAQSAYFGGVSKVINKGVDILKMLSPFQMVWISNNVDYIVLLENGSSKQAPAGMVALTVEELREMFV